MVKKLLKSIVVSIFDLLPKKYILLESYPDYFDNTFAVYNYIISNYPELKHRVIWKLNDKKNTNKYMKSFSCDGSFFAAIKGLYYTSRSKIIVFCNNRVDKVSKNQKSLYLTHGSIAKDVTGKCVMRQDLDYCLVQSDYLKTISKEGFSLSKNTKMITLGFPRNDDLLLQNNFDKNDLFDANFEKMVVWYPTFRQHKASSKRNVSSITLPIIHDEDEATMINDFAKENKLLIVLKPHFAQDTSYIKDLNLSNIVIINDDFLVEKGIRSYQLLNLSDALITDYSSVYYDYLLTDKPIGLTWDDYDEYKEKEGFLVDTETIFAGGEKIYNSDDFCNFIKNVADGNDVLKIERNEVKDLTNYYQDADSSKRVTEFIIKHL